MNIIHGKSGSIRMGENEVFGVVSWRLEIELATVDATPMDADWREPEAALAGFGGEFVCIFDLTDPGQKSLHDALASPSPQGEVADVKFHLDENRCYSGLVLITSFRVAHTTREVARVVFRFAGKGELTPPDEA